MDGAHPCEALWDASESVDWVDEGRVSVSSVGVHVELDSIDGVKGGLIEVFVVGVESDGVADKVDGVRLEFEGVEELSGGELAGILLGGWVVGVELLDELEEALAPGFLDHAHQAGVDGFLVVGGHFLDLGSSLREESLLLHLVHEGAIDRFGESALV